MFKIYRAKMELILLNTLARQGFLTFFVLFFFVFFFALDGDVHYVAEILNVDINIHTVSQLSESHLSKALVFNGIHCSSISNEKNCAIKKVYYLKNSIQEQKRG